jgi:hypothetical protein
MLGLLDLSASAAGEDDDDDDALLTQLEVAKPAGTGADDAPVTGSLALWRRSLHVLWQRTVAM